MKTRRFTAMAFAGLITCSIGFTSAGPAELETPDPNMIGNPLLRAFLTDREPRERIEGQFSHPEDCRNAVMRELLGATAEQWQQIEPKFSELEAVRERTRAVVGSWVAGASFGGGSGGSYRGSGDGAGGGYNDSRRGRRNDRSAPRRRAVPPRPPQSSAGANSSSLGPWRPSQGPPSAKVTGGERLCGELLDLIDRANATSEEIREKMAQLAAYRRKAAEEIKQAQEALRQVLTRRQEAALILMGYLD